MHVSWSRWQLKELLDTDHGVTNLKERLGTVKRQRRCREGTISVLGGRRGCDEV